MRELLEVNAGLPESAKMAIAGDCVLVIASHRLEDLSPAEPGRCIEAVMAFADGFDNGFKLEYSGTSRRR